jgi:threonyl-tRNA synthetase
MSLEFTIIPVTSDFESFAYNIQTKIKDNIKLEITTNIDTHYNISLNTRINKWRRLSHNVVTVDQNYNQSHSIVVIFSDKGSRSQVMNIDEFIDLLSSFEEDDDENKEHSPETKDTKSPDDNQDGGCIIS